MERKRDVGPHGHEEGGRVNGKAIRRQRGIKIGRGFLVFLVL